MKRPLRAVLAGCGNIGSLLDEGRSTSFVLTHASAIATTPGLSLVAVCDANRERARTCAAARGVSTWFTTPSQLGTVGTIDLLVLALPPDQRLPFITAAVELGVGAIFCEKPIAANCQQAAEIAALVRGEGIVFAVNFLRRWSPALCWLRNQLSLGAIGEPLAVSARYSGGLLNNGSHLIDLVSAVFDRPRVVAALPPISLQSEAADSTQSAILICQRDGHQMPVHLLGLQRGAYAVLELDIYGHDGRLRLVDSGRRLLVERCDADPDFPGYRWLVPAREMQGGLEGALEAAYRELTGIILGGGGPPSCGLEEGISAIEVVQEIRDVTPKWDFGAGVERR